MALVTASRPSAARRSGESAASVLSLRHQKVQRLRRLLSRRTARESDAAFVVEGTKVLSEALAAGAPVESVYVAAGAAGHDVVQRALDAGVRVHELAEGVLERVADTVTPQPILAVVGFVHRPLVELRDHDLLVVAVDVRDPGNAGTVLRSAEAAGAGGVVFCDGSVDVYNPKTVRASAGSLFHVHVAAGGDPVQVLREMASWGVRRLGTVASGGTDYTSVDLTGPVAFVLGNEANGLNEHVGGVVDASVTIPMAGRGESLNVGMAAAVLCFEASRQRRAATVPS